MRAGGTRAAASTRCGPACLSLYDYVSLYGSIKQKRFLLHKPDLASQEVQRQIPHVMSINQYFPACTS